MDAGVDVNEGSDTDSEKAKSTSVDGGPPEENGTTDSPLASTDDAESRATGPQPSSGSPAPERSVLSRHTKTSPPSKASGRSWMPPLKKFFSTDSWFRKKEGIGFKRWVSHRDISLSLSPETLEYGKMPLEEKRKHYTCGEDYLAISDIPTWAEFHKSKFSCHKLSWKMLQHILQLSNLQRTQKSDSIL